MSEPRETPQFAAWSSSIGGLPTSILPPVTDPVLRGWLELILLRQEVIAVELEALTRRLSTLQGALAASLIDELRVELRREISEGLAKAALQGRQAARRGEL